MTAGAVKDMEPHKAMDELLSQFDEHQLGWHRHSGSYGLASMPYIERGLPVTWACVKIAKRKQQMRDGDL